jgi:hypothetical protein
MVTVVYDGVCKEVGGIVYLLIINTKRGGEMSEERRKFLKIALGAGVVGVGALMGGKAGMAAGKEKESADSNGVVIGHSPKKEILYRKTANWDIYYKSSY